MSLRSFTMTFGKLWLFVAVFFVLYFHDSPSRLGLLGTWLALLLNVGTNENGYAVIAIIPLLWWWREPKADVD